MITVRYHSPDIHGGAGRYASEATSTSLLQRVSVRDPEAWERLADVYGAVLPPSGWNGTHARGAAVECGARETEGQREG